MNFLNKNSGAIAVIALVMAIVGVFTPAGKSVVSTVKSFGGATNYDEVDATAIKIGGSSGSRVGPIIASTGALIYSNPSVTASTTKAFDIAVTGVVSGDVVFAQTATTSANQIAGSGAFIITGAQASTTSGFITVQVANLSGATAVVPREIASGTPYLVLHPVTTVPGL